MLPNTYISDYLRQQSMAEGTNVQQHTMAEGSINGLSLDKAEGRKDSGVWVGSSEDSEKNGTLHNDVFENGTLDDSSIGKLQRQLATDRSMSHSSSIECDDYYTKFYRQFLSCNICRRAFNDQDRLAKYLPCLHTLCLHCIQGSTNGCNKGLICPFCKAPAPQDIDSLPTNFHVKQMREYLGVDDDEAVGRGSRRGANLNGKSRAFLCEGCSKQARAIGCCGTCVRYLCRECITAHQFNTGSDDHEVLILVDLKGEGRKRLQEQRIFCPMHNHQPMTLYCNGPKCQIPVCKLCATFAHKEQTWHEVVDLAKVADKSEHELREMIDKSLGQWDPLEFLLMNIHDEIDQLDCNAAKAEREISEFFAKRRSELDKREQDLIKAVHNAKDNMAQHLRKQKEAAEMTIASVTAMCNFADVALEEDSKVETVMALQRLKPVLDVLATRDFHTKPLSNTLVKFKHNHNSAEIFHRLAVKDLGKVQTSDVVPFLTSMKMRPAFVDLECSFTLLMTDVEGQESKSGGTYITAEMTDPNDEALSCLVQDNLNGSYYIIFTPTMIGIHYLKIYVCEEQIRNLEVEVCKLFIDTQPATVGNESLITIQATTKTGRPRPLPQGMDIKVSLLDPTRRNLPCKVTHRLTGHYDVKFTPKKIGNHYMQMLIDDQTPKIEPIDVIVHRAIFLSSPETTNFYENNRGVVVSSKGHIFVADTTDNKQIIEFNSHGHHMRHFPVAYKDNCILAIDKHNNITVLFINKKCAMQYDKLGNPIKKFSTPAVKSPIGVAVNSRNETLILDSLDCCVYIHNEDGKIVHKIGKQGSIVADLNYPVAICVDSYNNTYVSDKGNHQVLQIDHEGETQRQFGNRDTLRHPGSIAITPDNFLLVHDERLSQVVHVFGMKSCQVVHSIKVHGIAGFREGITVTPDWYFIKVDHKGECLRKYTYR